MEYNIRLDYDLPPTEESGDALVSALEAFSPAAGPSETGSTDVWITVHAAGIRQAIATGLALSRTASDASLLGFEVISTAEFDRRQLVTDVPKLIGSDEAGELLGISRQAILKKFAAGEIPGSRVGDRTVVFALQTIEKLAERRQQQGDSYRADPGERYQASL